MMKMKVPSMPYRTLAWACAVLFAGGTVLSCLGMLDTVSGVTLDRIRERGRLIAVTSYNENSYFIYRGEPFGFEYELLTLLADELGVELEVRLTDGSVPLIDVLNSEQGDLIAASIAVTKKRLAVHDFTDHIMTSRQVLVQRSADSGLKPVRDVTRLIGKTITVIERSHYHERLINLSAEIGGDIHIRTVPPEITEEELIRQVSDGTIEYTIADESIAMIHRLYYSGIDIETPVSFPQRIAWVVRRRSPELVEFVNWWIAKAREDGTIDRLYRKYYMIDRVLEEKMSFSQDTKRRDTISQYDGIIRKYSDLIQWDWRLIASIIYQESRFNPSARSWAGAVGLMQLMPETARFLLIKNREDPEE
ncbi:MAG: transporter substrate-binding domain-containing protein, partial [Spirochaetota bacterium]